MTEKQEGVVASSVLAQLFDCDEKSIRNLAARGILVKSGHGKYVLSQSIRNYVRHLREIASGRGGETEVLNLTAERAKFAREQAEYAALKNAEKRGELLPAREVEGRWATIMSAIRSQMLSIPSVVAQLLPLLTRADIEIIDRAVRDALNSAADEVGADRIDG